MPGDNWQQRESSQTARLGKVVKVQNGVSYHHVGRPALSTGRVLKFVPERWCPLHPRSCSAKPPFSLHISGTARPFFPAPQTSLWKALQRAGSAAWGASFLGACSCEISSWVKIWNLALQLALVLKLGSPVKIQGIGFPMGNKPCVCFGCTAAFVARGTASRITSGRL